jgi:hypothetical protein
VALCKLKWWIRILVINHSGAISLLLFWIKKNTTGSIGRLHPKKRNEQRRNNTAVEADIGVAKKEFIF